MYGALLGAARILVVQYVALGVMDIVMLVLFNYGQVVHYVMAQVVLFVFVADVASNVAVVMFA